MAALTLSETEKVKVNEPATSFVFGVILKNLFVVFVEGFKAEYVPPDVEEEVTVEKTVEKLTERNMLGRLAKQLKLNEEGKQKMFAYFEKGELKQ